MRKATVCEKTKSKVAPQKIRPRRKFFALQWTTQSNRQRPVYGDLFGSFYVDTFLPSISGDYISDEFLQALLRELSDFRQKSLQRLYRPIHGLLIYRVSSCSRVASPLQSPISARGPFATWVRLNTGCPPLSPSKPIPVCSMGIGLQYM